MRFILFYVATESFNYFTDEIAKELADRGHDIFILDLAHMDAPGHSVQEFTAFCGQKVDAVICFDREGIHNDAFIDLWDTMDTCAVHILMDHPLRFHPTMEHHPRKYIQFSPDEEHVSYVKKYFPEIEHVEFLSHSGTVSEEKPVPYGDRPYDILFSGTYYVPDAMINELEYMCPKDSKLYQIYLQIGQDLIAHTEKSLIQSVTDTLHANQMDLSDASCKTIMRGMTPIDWMVRMYYREKVISVLVDAGMEVYVLGRGWENHPCAGASNLHILSDRINLAGTFPYMQNAKINVNVMPWFKAGTHDRIFNTMLRRSICLTDSSTWIDSHFTDGEDIVLYDLKELEKLPDIAAYWLEHHEEAEELIEKGYQKTLQHYTWSNCVDSILESLHRNYGIG
jgi:hypothetical protein